MRFILSGFGVIAALRRWFSGEPSVFDRLRSVTATSIADVADGALVKIRGRVVLASESCLESPLTGRRCAAYKFEIVTERPIHLVNDQQVVEFAIEDETGRALIKAHGARLFLVRDAYHAARGTDGRHDSLAKRYGVSRPLGFGQDLYHQEAVLEPGTEVAVLSHARWERDPSAPSEAGYRDQPTRLVMETTDDARMIISTVTATLK